MSFHADLRTRLTGNGTVAGLVSTRIYWEIRPQNSALPAIVLTEVAGNRDQSFSGPMGTQVNRIQFDCMATTGEAARALRDAVLAVIESAGTGGTTNFQGGFVNLTRSTVDDTTTTPVRVAMIDASIWFN